MCVCVSVKYIQVLVHLHLRDTKFPPLRIVTPPMNMVELFTKRPHRLSLHLLKDFDWDDVSTSEWDEMEQ